MERKEISPVRTVIVLTCICAVISLLVAGVYALTKNQIALNNEQKIENAISEIFPSYSGKSVLEGTFDGKINAVYKINSDGATAYAVDITAKGYGSDGINMMVGVSGEEKVISVVIVSASGETPGLGQNVTKKEYTDGFTGLSLGEKADIISGATISSKGVQDGIDICLQTVKKINSGEISVREAA